MNGFEMIDRAVAAFYGDSMFAMDEVSLLFESEERLIDFQHECYRNSVVHFNGVHRDTMVRLDKAGEEFVVRFEFFRLVHRPWRIEAMCVISGDAPLHEEALASNGNGAPFHLSYKLADVEAYADGVGFLRRELGYTMAAEYRNSYGMMSYWTNDGNRGPYIKPRVNLRD